jgi:hypothetical protein
MTEHYASCTERAYGKAVLHLTSISPRHALTLEEIARAARSQMDHCTCATLQLKATNEKLRILRKAQRDTFNADRAAVITELVAERDALKAAL